MSVKVREKKKGSGEWWLFINHRGQRRSKKIGSSKVEATRLATILAGRLAAGQLGLDDLNRKKEVKPFSFYCDQWLTVIMPKTCKRSTQDDYRSIHRVHLKAAPFYSVSVDQITVNDIELFLIDKLSVRSRSTVNHIKNVISNSFERAEKADVIAVNPCAKVSLPDPKDQKDKTAKPEPFNESEVDILLDTYAGDHHHSMIFFLARTGCRTGEIAGLQWGDLDFDLRKAHIRRAIVRGRVTNPKNGKDRKVDLSPQLVSVLREHKLKHQGASDYVFQTKSGKRMDFDHFRRRVWYPMLEKAELRRTRLHDLRHHFASMLIIRTKDIYYAQRQLGHHSITVTVDRYGHLLDEHSETRPVDMLDAPNRTLCAPETKKALNGKR